jgi:F-type H+-transporting ATPase subunit epsilon
MAETFKFELVTPERMLLSQQATQVVVSGSEGRFTVLPGHAPVISLLRPGVIEASLDDSRKMRVFVKGGFAEVEPDRLTVLAERAIEVEAMDTANELATAEADLAAAGDDAARFAAHAAVEELRSLRG